MLVRGERGQAATAASLKNSPSCFSDYQHCKLGNRPSARKGLYANCKVRTIYSPAPTNSARGFNRILVFAVLFSGVWMFLFTAHSLSPLGSTWCQVTPECREWTEHTLSNENEKNLNEAQESSKIIIYFFFLKIICDSCQLPPPNYSCIHCFSYSFIETFS